MTPRHALAGEADALAGVHAASFAAPWNGAEIAALLADEAAFGLVVGPAAPVAFLIGRGAADEAEILTLAVRPDARRRGLGAALVEAAGREAARRGASALFLEVATDNVAALALYARCGLVPAGRRRAYYARGDGARVDALVLRRDLTG